MKAIFIISFTLFSFYSKGQISNPWYGEMTNKIDHIQKNEFDSVFAYITAYGYPSMGEEIKGIGKIDPQGDAVIIGFSSDKISCIKIIKCYDTIYSSKPIDLKVDSILQNLRTSVAQLKSEFILPCVYEVYADSISTIPGFYPAERRLHSSFSFLYFKCSTDSDIKEFNLDDLKEKREYSNSAPPNLNFKFNNSLKLYKLYSYLNTLSTIYQNQFDYKK